MAAADDTRWEEVFYKLDRPMVDESNSRSEKERALRMILATMAEERAHSVNENAPLYDQSKNKVVYGSHEETRSVSRRYC